MRIGAARTGEEIALAELTDIFIGAYGSANHGWDVDWLHFRQCKACVRVRCNQSPLSFSSAGLFCDPATVLAEEIMEEVVGEAVPGNR